MSSYQGCRGDGISLPILTTYPYPWGSRSPWGSHTHGRVQGCRGDGISLPIPTTYPYPWGSPWGSPYPRQSPGLPWGRNFPPHTHHIPIPMGIPIPTTDLAVIDAVTLQWGIRG